MADLDPVFAYYGLSDPFPTSWDDKPIQESQFAFVLGDYFNGADDGKSGSGDSGGWHDMTVLQRNFDMFVKMKSTLDTAHKEMKKDFLQESKNWGVADIDQLIDDANMKAAQIMKPVMDNKSKGDRLKATLSLIEKNRYLFDLPGALLANIKRGDHDSLVRDYRRGRTLTEEIRTLPHSTELSDYLVQQRRVIERIWGEVEVVVEDYKSSVWKQLSEARPDDNYVLYISILLELGVEDNPIWVWLQTLVDNLKSQMEEAFDDLNSSLQILRKEVCNTPPASTNTATEYFLNAIKFATLESHNSKFATLESKDLPEIERMWVTLKDVIEEVTKYFGKQIALFWECASGFLDGRTQSSLPVGQKGESKVHLTLSREEDARIRTDARELVELYASSVADFFVRSVADSEDKAANVERTKTMDSESEMDANTPRSERKMMNLPNTSAASLSASARLATSLKNDRIAEAHRQIDLPTTSPSSLEAPISPRSPGSEKNFELYAFLPPNANAIGTTFFLSQLLNTLGSLASELAGLSISSRHIDVLRTMMSTVRERCVGGACLSWQQDAKRFKMAEDWNPTSTRKCTRVPGLFLQYQSVVLDGLQKLVFIPGAEKKSKAVVILPPSSKLVSSIKTQFANSIFLTLNGLVQCAVAGDKKAIGVNGSPLKTRVPNSTIDQDIGTPSARMESRLLLMICNIAELNGSVVSALFERFSSLFSIQLTDNSNIIGDAMTQLDEQLFTTFTKKKRANFTTIIRTGILRSGILWSQLGKPTDVSPYIYHVLLQLVLLHMQVSSVGPILVKRVITDLLHHIVNTILESFRQIDKFSLGGMLQATIDVEFVNQKMTVYGTPDIENLYQTCYATIQDATDRSKMEVDVMTRQLEDMKKLLLKCHKQSRMEFLCFKEEKPTKSREMS
ncbi:exocyst complex component Sec5-domain-containing protein [Lipomyces tetrasporus]|uniref:Exocyst complex component SEC5 n=1 Tax=Lipomyces tetrasporus TaxID=54092 RepID=A0AAD7QZC9_9ASCO|nr:exocyst complex component Sec5-domain-containing protein [Lipomyces tetrasporus]KAJ8104277.1 exocyst complex component Sec5-domain-containing protein [Lipomyces tetrasporus]